MKICHKPFQKEYTEIRERISTVLMTDVLCGKFEAIPNIGIAVRADQSIHGFAFPVVAFTSTGISEVMERIKKSVSSVDVSRL